MRSPGLDLSQRSASKVTSTEPAPSCLKDSRMSSSSAAISDEFNSRARRGAPPARLKAASHERAAAEADPAPASGLAFAWASSQAMAESVEGGFNNTRRQRL